jgi:hypothetical protein
LASAGSIGVVLLRDAGTVAETWTFDGQRWTRLAVQSPPLRFGGAFAFDAPRGRLVLFGGASADGSLLDDTWEFDGATWSRK